MGGAPFPGGSGLYTLTQTAALNTIGQCTTKNDPASSCVLLKVSGNAGASLFSLCFAPWPPLLVADRPRLYCFCSVRTVSYSYQTDGKTYSYSNSFVGAMVTEVNASVGSAWGAVYSVNYDPATLVVNYITDSVFNNPSADCQTCGTGKCTGMSMQFVPGCIAGATLPTGATLSAATFFPSGSGYYTLTQNSQLSAAGGYTAIQSNCVALTIASNTGTAVRGCLQCFTRANFFLSLSSPC